ncbi:unnamed protein product [Trichobilharzia szidati]|nr:unnamed protein product [Trichobilharzia szidati]
MLHFPTYFSILLFSLLKACRNILKDCLQTTNNNVDEAVLLALNRITLNSNSNNNSDNTTGKELNTSKRNKTIVTASKSSPSTTTTTTTTADIDEKLDEKAKSLVLDRYDFVSESGGGGGGQLAKPKLPSVCFVYCLTTVSS